MIATNLSALWSAVAPGLGNHLWQSTLVAAVAGLLALTLRKNQARARYWVWLAASVKFLIPFSLLVEVGNRLAWLRASAGTNAEVLLVMEQVTQPFTQAAVIPTAASPTLLQSLEHLLPAGLTGIWAAGLVAVLAMWCVRWRRVAAARRTAMPLREGREIEALRRLNRTAGLRVRLEMVLSQDALEPGIFGIARPVLMWPAGISQRLDDHHLEAVIAHELWHVRRRDNLAAAIHMVVEALFWFHPLVWWVGARLVEEREQACDEAVLQLGSKRQVYAESILKVCEFCVGSPLACVSGVTGADLKKRMVHIMNERIARKLDAGKKLMLGAAMLLALAIPVGFGVVNATQGHAQAQEESANATRFTASVKPSDLSTPTYAGSGVHMVRMMYGPKGFEARNASLLTIIQDAYGVQADQIPGAPPELAKAAYDIEIKAEESASQSQSKDPFLRQAEIRSQLRTLLAERFKLVLHHETKVLPQHLLEVGENGSKLQPTRYADSPDTAAGPDGKAIHRMLMREGDDGQVMSIEAQKSSMAELARQLSMQLGENVVDKTGLAGQYDFNLQWARSPGNDSLFTAVQEQLGLKLVPQQAPSDALVIDHVELPEMDASR